MQKEAFAVLWFSYAGDGARALGEIVPVDGMDQTARRRLQRRLEQDPYVARRVAELQGVAAERAVDDLEYIKQHLRGVIEEARADSKYTAAAVAIGQYAKVTGLDGTLKVDVTSGGQPVTITRRIIDPSAEQ